MEIIVLKSIEVESAVCKLYGLVLGMQTAVNQGASVEEVNKHYESIREQTLKVQQMAGEVRSCSFQIAAKYHFEWDV